MNLRYDTLTIENDLTVIQIERLKLEEALNEHPALHITFLCEQETAEESVLTSTREETIRVSEDETCLFVGFLAKIRMTKEKAQTVLETVW